MTGNITHPTWDELHEGAVHIMHQAIRDVRFSFPIPSVIVGLARGGLVPAITISHELELLGFNNTVIPVSYSSKVGVGDGRNHLNTLPDIDGIDVLVVDDICDSGHTLLEVANHYAAQGKQVRTAALYYKVSSIHTPTYFWREIPSDSPWIIFSWENSKYQQ